MFLEHAYKSKIEQGFRKKSRIWEQRWQTHRLFMPSAYLSVLLLMQDSLELKFWCVSWHTLTGLIFRQRDICPEFFLVDLLFTLLRPKQSDFKSPGTSKPAMTPLWRESYPSDGHSGSCIATSGVRHQLAGKAPAPLFLVSCRWHRGLVNVLTTLWGCTRSITLSSF